MKLKPQKLESGVYNENYTMLISTVWADPPVWQTDGQTRQTDGRKL